MIERGRINVPESFLFVLQRTLKVVVNFSRAESAKGKSGLRVADAKCGTRLLPSPARGRGVGGEGGRAKRPYLGVCTAAANNSTGRCKNSCNPPLASTEAVVRTVPINQ